MSFSRASSALDSTDLDIAISLGAGLTKEGAAEFAGVDRSTVYNRLGNPIKKAEIERIAARIKAATAESIQAATARAKAKLESMYEQAIENLGGFMASNDERIAFGATKEVIDRVAGKATQRIENTGTINHQVAVLQIPQSEASYLMQIVGGTQRVLAPASEVIDLPPLEE